MNANTIDSESTLVDLVCIDTQSTIEYWVKVWELSASVGADKAELTALVKALHEAI
jgi:hypothetical protein